MIPRLTKTTLHKLFKEWQWKQLNRRKHVGRLIWTDNGAARKDNRTTVRVGKPIIKFKFEIGSYLGGTVTNTPRHFCIETTSKQDRISWMATPQDEVFLKRRIGKVWQAPVKLTGFFEDPYEITNEELEFLELLYPGICSQVVELLPGLHGIDDALKEKFNG
jgi:hypothetical protein